MEKINITPEKVFCPQPMYLVGTKDENGIVNFAVKTWITMCWNNSPHISFCNVGETKTKENLIKTKAFSANLVSCDILNLADYLGNVSGKDAEKNTLEYKYTNGNILDVPVLEESKWVFECELTQKIQLSGSELFIGEIKNIQIDKKLENMDRESIDLIKLDPVIYAWGNYFSIKEKIGKPGTWKVPN